MFTMHNTSKTPHGSAEKATVMPPAGGATPSMASVKRCRSSAMKLLLLLLSVILKGASSCPEGEVAQSIMKHFMVEEPRGIPGGGMPEPMPLPGSISLGLVTLKDMTVGGLDRLHLQHISVYAHLFMGSVTWSVPGLRVAGTYEMPGLWWTTTGNFSLTLHDVHCDAVLQLAVLEDSCFHVHDYQVNITRSTAEHPEDDNQGLEIFMLDDFFDLFVNLTKPTILDIVNYNLRVMLTTFLPLSNETLPDSNSTSTSTPDSATNATLLPTSTLTPTSTSSTTLTPADAPTSNSTASATPTDPLASLFPSSAQAPVVIPSYQEQVDALIRFVRFQIPWMIGSPLELPGQSISILGIAQLHNMSVHNLDLVTAVEALSFEFDGECFGIKSQMLHQRVYNRHRVLWFPGSLFNSWWQWTEAKLGLVRHSAVLTLGRRLEQPPVLEKFSARPVVFNPDHQSSSVRRISRLTRRLMDSMRTQFGDSMKALLYSPIVKKVNKILHEVDTLSLVKEFVCFAAAGVS